MNLANGGRAAGLRELDVARIKCQAFYFVHFSCFLQFILSQGIEMVIHKVCISSHPIYTFYQSLNICFSEFV